MKSGWGGKLPPHLLKPVTALSSSPPSRFHRDSFQSHGEEYLLQRNPSGLRPSPPDSRGSSTLTGEKTTLPHFVIYPPIDPPDCREFSTQNGIGRDSILSLIGEEFSGLYSIPYRIVTKRNYLQKYHLEMLSSLIIHNISFYIIWKI